MCTLFEREKQKERKLPLTSRPRLTSPSSSTSHSSSNLHSSSLGSVSLPLPLPFPSTSFSPPQVQTFTSNLPSRSPSQFCSESSSSNVGVESAAEGEGEAGEDEEAEDGGEGRMKPSLSMTKVGCIVLVAGVETKKGVESEVGSAGIENPFEGVTGLERVLLLAGRFLGLVHPLVPTPSPIPADAESLRTIRPRTEPPRVGARLRPFEAASSAGVGDEDDGRTSSSETNESTSLRRRISSCRAFSLES